MFSMIQGFELLVLLLTGSETQAKLAWEAVQSEMGMRVSGELWLASLHFVWGGGDEERYPIGLTARRTSS